MEDSQPTIADSVPVQCWSFAACPPKTARDRILSAASRLFCHHGFASTGIDAVIAEAGTAKATLYKHFPSKDDLIAAVLEVEGETWRKWFFDRLRATKGAPEARVLALFDILEDWFTSPDFYGCPFINATGEFDTGNPSIKAAADAHKAHLKSWLMAQALDLGAPDPEAFVRAIVVLVDGAIVAAQHARDPKFAQDAKTVAAAYLAGYGDGAGAGMAAYT